MRPAPRGGRDRGDRGGDSDRGLSLIELVAAMAIFALVAVMGAEALGGMLRLRASLTQRSAEAAALDRTVSLLRADLAALVPMLFYPPGQAAPQSALSFRNGVLALSAGGRPGLAPGAGPGLQRIEWRLAGGRLSRRVWTALAPASAAARQPEMPVLEGVAALRLRSYWEGAGWQEGASPLAPQPPAGASTGASAAADSDRAGPAPEVYSSTLPLAAELTLETRAFGRITLVETLK